MNVELLERVRRAILYRPRRFCAAQWAFARNARVVVHDGDRPQQFKCCIAGHVLLESGTYSVRKLLRKGGFHNDAHPWEEAGAVVELTEAQWRELFFPSQWDMPYKQEYYLCSRDEEAEVAAAYIDHFISKHAGTPCPTGGQPLTNEGVSEPATRAAAVTVETEAAQSGTLACF